MQRHAISSNTTAGSARAASGGTPPSTPAGRNRLTLLTLCLAVLIAQIDTAVVNLAIHPIQAYFNASVAAMQWVVDSYNLAYAALLLTGGLLADLYGRRRMFMAGAAIFTAASLLCGLASGVEWLIAGRILAGIGSALMIPASLALVRVAWPDQAQRGRALGIWAACNGVAFVIAPTLGGVLIQWLGWRSIFFLVVPIGAAALALALPCIPKSSDPQARRFDLAAQILGATALGGLAVSAIEASHRYSLALLALIVSVLAFILFLRVETAKGPMAMVPLDMFRTPLFRGAVIATASMTFGMYGLLFLLPLTWQSSGLLDSTQAGLALMPMALAFMLVSPYTGTLIEKIGSRSLMGGGVALIGCGLLALSATAGIPSAAIAQPGLILAGIGMGLATGPLLGAAVGAVAAIRSGTAAALINVARMAGATLGVAILGAAFSSVHGGTAGLRLALGLGGLAQIACVALAWPALRPPRQTRT